VLFVSSCRPCGERYGNVGGGECRVHFDDIFLGLALHRFARRTRLLRLRIPAFALFLAAIATLAFLASFTGLAFASFTRIVVLAAFARFAVTAATWSLTIASRLASSR
jgi:hypothetical protein